jgi:hypothetical protein
MLGAIAQLETELRAARQRDAIEDARARGVTCCRTPRLYNPNCALILFAYAAKVPPASSAPTASLTPLKPSLRSLVVKRYPWSILGRGIVAGPLEPGLEVQLRGL